jgi:hypothetical protein
MDKQLYAQASWMTRDNRYPVGQLIGQVTGFGDSFVAYY